MNSKIIMVTGGQRCGKSEFAENMALELADVPVYLATSAVENDEDFRERVKIHRERRGPRWITVEEPLNVGAAVPDGKVVLVDCVTLWATNVFFASGENVTRTIEQIFSQLSLITDKESTVIFVTNEIGLGGVSENALQRRFTDVQGRVNQKIASMSEAVYLIISGLPVKIK